MDGAPLLNNYQSLSNSIRKVLNCKVTLDDELYPFLGIASKNILKKSCLQECAKKWVAITAGTLLYFIYFSINSSQTFLVQKLVVSEFRAVGIFLTFSCVCQ